MMLVVEVSNAIKYSEETLIWSNNMRHQKALDNQSDWPHLLEKNQRVVGEYTSLPSPILFPHHRPNS